MQYSFHPEAEKEFLHSVDYYDKCSRGLGYDFAFELYEVVKGIQNYPQAFPILNADLRRAQLKRFPYGIIYDLKEGHIRILAVMNLHRDPGYWQERIK